MTNPWSRQVLVGMLEALTAVVHPLKRLGSKLARLLPCVYVGPMCTKRTPYSKLSFWVIFQLSLAYPSISLNRKWPTGSADCCRKDEKFPIRASANGSQVVFGLLAVAQVVPL